MNFPATENLARYQFYDHSAIQLAQTIRSVDLKSVEAAGNLVLPAHWYLCSPQLAQRQIYFWGSNGSAVFSDLVFGAVSGTLRFQTYSHENSLFTRENLRSDSFILE